MTFRSAGECRILATQAGDARFLPGQAEQLVTVGRSPQVVSFVTVPPPDPVVGDTYDVVVTGVGPGTWSCWRLPVGTEICRVETCA